MMTAANVVLLLATSLFIVVISGREKANALVFPLSMIFFFLYECQVSSYRIAKDHCISSA